MNLRSTLKGCHDALCESAKQHRAQGDPGHARMCELHAGLALKHIDDETRERPLALLAECKRVGPSEIIPDGEFEPTSDKRF